MSPDTRTSISALPRGHEFAPATFAVTREQSQAYLHAIGDTNAYGDAAPPLALVALGLAVLQERLSLPDASLHTGQEVEHEAKAPVGAELMLTGRIAQRSERQGFVISVIEFEVSHGGARCLRARTTIMAPAA